MTGLQRMTGLFRRFRSLVLRRPVRITGQCKMCGRCCRDILLKYEGKWLRSEKQYRAMLEKLPLYSRFEPVGDDGFGCMTFTCRSLGSDNWCTNYEDRPSLCRNYPSKSLYYQGGGLRSECGFSFSAVTFRDAIFRRLAWRTDFSRVLDKELEREEDTKS